MSMPNEKQDLKHQAAQLQAILSTVDECYKVVDEHYRLIDMNETGLRLIEAPSMEEVRGACVLDLLLPEHHETFKAGIAQALNGERVTQEFEIQGLAGTRRWMQQTVVALPPEQGRDRPTQVAAFTRDISHTRQAIAQLRQARDQAEEANKAKSEFLANMSHELRTPMTSIVGFTDLVAEYLETDTEKARSALETVKANVRHLYSVINDVLDVSKIDAGQMTVESIDVYPDQLIEEVVVAMRPAAEDKGLRFSASQCADLPECIQSDPTRLKQILLNLLGNAIKFTNTGSVSLEVSWDATNRLMRFDVLDTGVGLSEKQLEKIRQYKAFAQADTSITRQYGGTGLGLRICNSLTQMMGGRMEISSDPGRGSRFSAFISIGDEERLDRCTDQKPDHQSRPVSDPAAEMRLDGIEVLVAEDGPDNQRLIKHFLTKAGANVTICEDGLVAYQTIQRCAPNQVPDVVFMDMQMPNLDGYGATSRLRQAGFNRPIIALTAHALGSEREKCLNAGCDEYMTKPINREQLVGTCHRYANSRQSA